MVVRRPSLLGAILVKARVVAKLRRGKHDSDRQDVIRLLSLIDDPRALAEREGLRSTEKRWLRTIQAPLDLNNADMTALFQPAEVARAMQAYRLLIR